MLYIINIFSYLLLKNKTKQEKILWRAGVKQRTGNLPMLMYSTECQAHHVPNAVKK